jgi:peptidoglycan/LPS O-acetylase OafA/YrhL
LLGPKILLLAPIWALGVALHRFQPLYHCREWQGWLLLLSSWLLLFLFEYYEVTQQGRELLKQWVGDEMYRGLAFSKSFMTDYLLALIIAANFIGIRTIAHRFSKPLLTVEKPVRWLAGYTFSLYIFHQPLLIFFSAVLNGDPDGALFYTQVMGATLVSIVLIGSYTEHKRHHLRAVIRHRLVWLFDRSWWRHGVSDLLANKQNRA